MYKKIGASVIVLVILCSVTVAPIFADNLPEGNRISGLWYGYPQGDTSSTVNAMRIYYSITWYDPYISNVAETMNQQNMAIGRDVTYSQDYTITFVFRNTSSSMYVIPVNYLSTRITLSNYTDTNAFNSAYDGFSIKSHTENVYPAITYSNTLSTINMDLTQDWFASNVSNIVLPPHANKIVELTYTRHNTVRQGQEQLMQGNLTKFNKPVSNIQLISPALTNSRFECYINNNALPYDTIYNTYEINHGVQSLLSAYTDNYDNTQTTQDNITSFNNQESSLHNAEVNFYQQNEQALQNVGISNFSFSSNQSSGIGSVVNDFTTLWNNIGPLQIIFTFTLSMSLATFLLRHKPVTGAIKKNQQR